MRIRRGTAIAIASAVIGFAALGSIGYFFRDGPVEERRAADLPTVAGEPAVSEKPPPASSGSVAGKARFTGNPPAFPQPESVVINPDGTLMNVLVHVSSGLEGKTFPVPAAPVVLEARDSRLVPHVFGIQVRQWLEFVNRDEIAHPLHALARNSRDGSLPMPDRSEKTRRKFHHPECRPPLVFKCEVHNGEKAYGGVFDHPFFAVTGDRGEFRIPDLPPGKYTLTAWHEKYGERNQTIEVPAWGSKRVEFEYQGE